MKGKHAQRAQARREAEAQGRITALENELKITSDELVTAKRQLAKKEGLAAALDLAINQAEEVTSPELEAQLARIADLEKQVADAKKMLEAVDGVTEKAVELLHKHEGLTWFEALEFLGIETGITSEMVTDDNEKKMSPAARRAYQRAKGIRRQTS